MTGGHRLAAAVRAACLLEVAAEKPGNVTPTRAFADLTAGDLRAAGEAVAPELARAGERPVGATILAAVDAARGVAPTNANLGIVLLLAPLARAAALGRPDAPAQATDAPSGADEPAPAARARLRADVGAVLAALDRADAAHAFAAIRRAGAGGLGAAPEHDVADEPAVGLREAMAAAAHRDTIAAEYADGYVTTFDVALPALDAALGGGLAPREAVVELHLELLAARPDTLIARKLGGAAAEEAARRAAATLRAGPRGSAARARATEALDAHLRADGHRRNPGTTADLVAAALFVAHLDGTLVATV